MLSQSELFFISLREKRFCLKVFVVSSFHNRINFLFHVSQSCRFGMENKKV